MFIEPVALALSRKAGRITGAHAEIRFQGGAFAGAPVELGAMSAFACYDLEHVKAVGYDVVTNRPKQAAYRAPGAPMVAFAVESVLDELAKKIGMDPIELRLKNAAKIEAANIRQLLSRLGQDHPKLKSMLDRGAAVAIDRQIYRDDRFRAIPPGSEVFILPRMVGG